MQNKRNITILGAGIMGLMTALKLAETHNVTLIDPKGFPPNANAENASFIAGGMLAPYSEIEHMDMKWVEAGLTGINIWRKINLDTGFTQNGSLLIAHAQDRYIAERFKSHLPPEIKTFQNVQSLEKSISQNFQNGLFLKEEAHLNPAKTMTAICENLKDKVEFKTAAANPNDINADWVIDCRGIGTPDPALRGVKGEIALVHNPDFTLDRPVRIMHPRYPLYVVPRDNNVFMIGATIIESNNDEHVSLRSSMELMSALYTLCPSFGDAQIIAFKAGIRPSYPDNLPRITIKDNAITCNGLFRHGYLLSPVMAACVNDYINENENQFMHLFTKGQNDEDHNQRAA